jgi:hypothetical protein
MTKRTSYTRIFRRIFFSDDSSSLSLQNYLISSMIYMEVHPEKYQSSERGQNFLITL